MKPGDIILTRNKHIPSKLIRAIGECEWSHVAVYVGFGKFIEATVGGVQISGLDKFEKEGCEYVWLDICRPIWYRKRMLDHLMTKLNESYDYSLLLGNALYRLFGDLRFFLRIADMPSSWTCVEFVADSMREAGELFSEDINMMPPDTFLDYGDIVYEYPGH